MESRDEEIKLIRPVFLRKRKVYIHSIRLRKFGR